MTDILKWQGNRNLNSNRYCDRVYVCLLPTICGFLGKRRRNALTVKDLFLNIIRILAQVREHIDPALNSFLNSTHYMTKSLFIRKYIALMSMGYTP